MVDEMSEDGVDWNLLGGALFGHDGCGGVESPTRFAYSGDGDGGDVELSVRMSRDVEDWGLRELEEEIRAWATAPPAEEKKDESVRSSMEASRSVYWLWQQRNRRGCERGECCVHHVWYDPEFARRHVDCTHVCRSSGEVFTHCSSSIFPDRVFSEFHLVYVGGNGSRDIGRPPRKFASYDRWRRLEAKRALCVEDVGFVDEVP